MRRAVITLYEPIRCNHTDPVNPLSYTFRTTYVQVNQLQEYLLQLRISENVSTIYFIGDDLRKNLRMEE